MTKIKTIVTLCAAGALLFGCGAKKKPLGDKKEACTNIHKAYVSSQDMTVWMTACMAAPDETVRCANLVMDEGKDDDCKKLVSSAERTKLVTVLNGRPAPAAPPPAATPAEPAAGSGSSAAAGSGSAAPAAAIDPKLIVGAWKLTMSDGAKEDRDIVWTFNADGTNETKASLDVKGKYTIVGNTLTSSPKEMEAKTYTILELTATSLKLRDDKFTIVVELVKQ